MEEYKAWRESGRRTLSAILIAEVETIEIRGGTHKTHPELRLTGLTPTLKSYTPTLP